MSDAYDNNGYNTADFKRNSNQDSMAENENLQDGEDNANLNEKAGEYVRELLSEKIKLSNGKCPMALRLIDEEVTKVQASGRIPARDQKYVDLLREKLVKVSVKVLVPIKEYPKFNFVGKLLGPKGNTMKLLQEETMCKMAVLGRGSMRDRQKEEELRNSLDPKYAHLADELHVEISALAPPAEAYARIAYALAEVKKYMTPDSNDMVRQNQMREMMERDGRAPPPARGQGVLYNAVQVTKRSYSYQDPVVSAGGRMPPPHMARAPLPPPPAKSKVMSILDRARSAMEANYGYEEHYAPEPQVPEQEFYYEQRAPERFYEEDGGREFKASARDVGTRRPGPGPAQGAQRNFARPQPYGQRPRPNKLGGGRKK